MRVMIDGLLSLRMNTVVSLLKTNYKIVEMQEEIVPLAPDLGTSYYQLTIIGMVMAILAVIMVMYLVLCNRSRKRIIDLQDDYNGYCGWNFWRLRETINELELQKTEGLIKEMETDLSY